MRTVFAIAIATLIVAAIPGTAQSAPIPPLPAGIMVHATDLTEVAWRRCWRDRWGACIVVAVGATVGAACAAAGGDVNS
jgi:hypothetical protein